MFMKSWLKSTRVSLQILLAVLIAIPPQAFGRSKTYNVGGEGGIKDPDGYSHTPGVRPSTPSTPGSDGPDGPDGGDAREQYNERGRREAKGWDSGHLMVTLAVPNDQTITVTGTRTEPERPNNKIKIMDTLPIDTDLKLLARGGEGAPGGGGGRGGDAGHGAKGYNAQNEYQDGGPGGDGGRGGDEGASTSGGDAGKAGTVTVRVSTYDQDAALALEEIDVRGNKGGAAGVGQGVGEGGSRGEGGDGFVWETKEKAGTDAQGNQLYKTVRHSTNDGSRGRAGSNGNKNTTRVHKGKDTPDGKFIYQVVQEDGKTVIDYDRPYHLTLLPGYKLTGSHNSNGFFEPGETITITGLTVINSGGSPTPKYQKVLLYLNDSKWIKSHAIELVLPEVLNPGESHTFTEPITFNLNELKRTNPDLLRETDVTAHDMKVTRINRKFKNFNNNALTTINVQYPIEITALESLVSLVPGQAAKVQYKIKNISVQTIGKMPGLDARAAHHIFRRTGGTVDANDFVIATDLEDPSADPSVGIQRALEGLKPGEERIVEIYVGFRDTAVNYKNVIFRPELYLESILNPDTMNQTQVKHFDMRVGQTFEYHKDAEVLLIANHNLDKKALDALRATAAIRKLTMDVWDFSLYGFFSFSNKIQDYENMFKAYRGKTIVILGNEIDAPTSKEHVQNLLDPNAIIEAARRYGIKVVVIDTTGDAKATVARMTEPTPIIVAGEGTPDQVRDYTSSEAYLKNLAQGIQQVQDEDGNIDEFLGIDRMQVRKAKWFGFEPTRKYLRERAAETLRKTQGVVPETQFFIDYQFNPSKKSTDSWKNLWGTRRVWNVGEMSIIKSVDDARTSVTAIQLQAGKIDDPNFILSEEFQTAFDCVLNYSTKMKLMNSIILGDFAKAQPIALPEGFENIKIPTPMQMANTLSHAILLDILHEQLIIRPYEYDSNVEKKELWNKLDLLKKLTDYDYSQFKLDPKSEEGQLFVKLIVDIGFFGKRSLSFSDNWLSWLPFKSKKNIDVSEVTQEMLDRLVNTVFDNTPKTNPEEKDIRAFIAEETKNRVKLSKEKGIKRDSLLSYLDPRNLSTAFVRDGQVHINLDDRVRSEKRQQSLREQNEARIRRAEQVRTAVVDQQGRLLLNPTQCAQLMVAGRGAAPAKGK